MSEAQTQKPVTEDPPRDYAKGFDDRVHVRDAATGGLIRHQPYRLRIKDGVRTYERPVGSGNLWYEDGKPANDHKIWNEPQDMSAQENEVLAKRNAELEAEIAALKEEQSSKLAATKTETPAAQASRK